MRSPVESQLVQRRLVADAKRRVVVASTSHFKGKVRARVLVDDEYYDVDERRLDLLLAGRTPAELELTPVDEDSPGPFD